MTDWHTSELSLLGRPRQTLLIHRLKFRFGYQPKEIGTSEKGAQGSRTGITPLQKATSGKQEIEKILRGQLSNEVCRVAISAYSVQL